MRERTVRLAGLAGYILMVTAILAVINLASYKHYARVDLTEEGAHTLSPQTRKIISALDQKVTIYAFVRPEKNRDVTAFFEGYTYLSGQVTFEIIDPDKAPAKAKKYGVTQYDTYVVEAQSGRREVASRLTEEDITGKIVRALTEKQKRIFVLEGHGERGLEDTNPLGWSGAKSALVSEMFLVEPFNWFSKSASIKEADLLVIAGPKDDFQEAEVKLLREYLAEGGRLLFTLDPGKRPALERLMSDYGVVYADDMILDPLSQRLGFEPLVATVSSYEKGHPVAEELKAVSFFTVARSITIRKDNPAKTEARPIATTADQSWGETDIASIDAAQPLFSEKDDHPGPLVVAASAEWAAGPSRGELKIGQEQRKGRMVAVGDSDFASNAMLAMSSNRDLFLNMVSWLLEKESQVSIRPKKPDFNPIMLSREQLAAIFWACVVVLPLSAVVTGVIVMVRRRRP